MSYRNQSIDLLRKSMDWFLYDIGLRHERVKFAKFVGTHFSQSTTGRLLLIVAVSIVVRRIDKENRKLSKRAVQVNEQVSEVVVRRLQIRCS